MRVIFVAVLVTVCAASFMSCENWNESDRTILTDTLPSDSTAPTFNTLYSDKCRLLLKNDSSYFRGFKPGDAKGMVLETGLEKIEESAESIMYAIPLDATESADISYTFAKNNVLSAIDVVVYLNSDSSVQAFKKELISYYSAKPSAAADKKNQKNVIINGTDNIIIEITEEGNSHVKDLHMRIFSLSPL